MGKTKLFIRPNKLNSKGEAVIFVRYSHRDRTVDFSTGERIQPKYWNKEDQQVRKSFRGFTGINNFIEGKKLEIDSIRLDLKARKIDPSIDNVKEEYTKVDRPAVVEAKSVYMLEHWEAFIGHQREVNRVEESTLKQYASTKKKIDEFEKHISCKLTFDMINKSFIDDFNKFMYLEKKVSHNTLGSKIKHIKSFLSWAVAEELTTNFKFKEFKRPSNETSIVTLTHEQLDIVFYLDFRDEPSLDRARDLFVLGCTTGLRFSDYSVITLANVKGDFLVMSTEKMDTQVRIPLNDYSRAILAKYPNGLPTLSNTNLNKHLKDIGIKAKFFDDHEVTTYKAGLKKKIYKPLYKMLTSHCARRTFATQSLQRGMQMLDVMKITGHRDIKSFMRYVHVAEPRLKQEADKAWNTLTNKR